MALSNWDILAVNETGKSIPGCFISTNGVVVEIYKNMLHMYNKKLSKAVITIEEGYLTYKDVTIFAKRGSQDGVFVIVYSRTYSGKDKKDKIEKYMIGCGVYGYDRRGNFVGVNARSLNFLRKLLLIWCNENYIDKSSSIRKSLNGKIIRYNQGDAFFAKALRKNIPASEVGKSKEPVLHNIVKSMVGTNKK